MKDELKISLGVFSSIIQPICLSKVLRKMFIHTELVELGVDICHENNIQKVFYVTLKEDLHFVQSMYHIDG